MADYGPRARIDAAVRSVDQAIEIVTLPVRIQLAQQRMILVVAAMASALLLPGRFIGMQAASDLSAAKQSNTGIDERPIAPFEAKLAVAKEV